MLRRVPPSRMLLILAVALMAGCATASPFLHRSRRPTSAQVLVRNDRWDDLTVYLLREQSLFRLGVVPGKRSATLTIPADYVRLNCWGRFVAQAPGHETQAVSELFGVGPGLHLSWIVPLTNGETPVVVTNPTGGAPPATP